MTPRQRQLATIRHEIPDRTSTDAICVETVPQIAVHIGIPEHEVLDRLGIDGRMVAAGFTGDLPWPGSPDEWGAAGTEDYGTSHTYPLADADVSAIERYPWPDSSDYDYEAAAAIAREWGSTYAVRGPYWRPLFCRVCSLMGMEEAMVKMVVEPAVFEGALDAVFCRILEYCRRLLDACGDAMPIFCLGDDFATQRGLMISPEQWRRFLKPRFSELFEMAKQRGKVVWFHSCGDITSILPDLIDIGLDVWETVQLHALPLSPQQLKSEFGRHITFFGGINTQALPFSDPESIRAEVRAAIEALGEGGGYICGPDHHVKPDVPPSHTLALFDEARAFSRPGYTLT